MQHFDRHHIPWSPQTYTLLYRNLRFYHLLFRQYLNYHHHLFDKCFPFVPLRRKLIANCFVRLLYLKIYAIPLSFPLLIFHYSNRFNFNCSLLLLLSLSALSIGRSLLSTLLQMSLIMRFLKRNITMIWIVHA